MSGSSNSGPHGGIAGINWLGVVSGLLMIALPFLGPWWIGKAGEALEIALSPFNLSMSVVGQPISSNLVDLLLLAVAIGMVIAGVFMIVASIFPRRWWSKHLIKYGATKPLWAVVGLIVFLIVGALLFNNVVAKMLPSLIGEQAGGMGVFVSFDLPYVIGTSYSSIKIGEVASITAPITFSLTFAFWVAVATSALGVAARIYHRRYSK
jgi:hypothetical protein